MVSENFRDIKTCVICGEEFSRIDFPRSFNRMVTCGTSKCAGERRKAKWKERYEVYKKGKAHVSSFDLRRVRVESKTDDSDV